MQYHSTRGGITGLSFEEALLSGYASDGGMIFPDSIPTIDEDTLKKWSKLSYSQLVKQILPLFISAKEIPRPALNKIVDKAFARFSLPSVVKVAKLKTDLNILELFHGPTLAFKDLAMCCVGQFMEYILEKRKKHVTVLVSTSGDTGSAAIESVRGLKWVDIVVLLPKNRCSRIQELQMTTVIEDNVHVYRVDATSDDLDFPIKKCFLDADLVKKHNLCSINSINWVRVLVQIAHYFHAYYQLEPDCKGEVEITVPTGACGNITGGVMARLMGLPVRLTSAVNANDILDRAFSKGDYSLADHVIETLAPAMNIQVPYNIERILYAISGYDTTLIQKFMGDFEKTGQAEISPELKNKIQIKSCSIDDQGIQAAMKRCWKENNYLLCPHSAVAAQYHYQDIDRNGPPTVPRMCIATASPAKFEEAVLSAGLRPQPTPAIKALDSLHTECVDVAANDDWEKILRDKIEAIYENRQ